MRISDLMSKRLIIVLLISGVCGVVRGKPEAVIKDSLRSDFEKSLEYAGIAISEPGYHVWGCSPVIGPEGKTHLFAARWPKATGFRPGWFTDSEIAHYVSDTPEGPFRFVDVVVKGTGNPDDWNCRSASNPTVQKIGDKYALLYISNNGKSRKNTGWQRTGMLIADSLYGPWKKALGGKPIAAPPPDSSYWNYSKTPMVVNPALLAYPDGRYFLYYKSGDTRKNHAKHVQMGLAVSDKLEGPYIPRKEPISSHADMHEDGYAFMMNDKFYFLTTGRLDEKRFGVKASGYGLLWESDDGIHFNKDPLLGFDRPNVYMKRAGVKIGKTTRYRGYWNFQRPQVLMRNGRPAYLYVPSGTNIKPENGSGSVCYVLKCNWKKD